VDRVLVVQHFHWDLCWWHSEEESRRNLVLALRYLAKAMERGDVPYFLLDGQVYPLEVAREVDPETFEALARLAREGRLEVGPLYTQVDLYRCSLESIVRSVLVGLELCREMRVPCSDVLYVPDSFGLPLSVPEIAAGLGLRAVVFSRGMSVEDLERVGSEFLWRSPSGSEVLAIYVPSGYLNAGVLGVEWSTVCRLRRYVALPMRLWSYASEIYLREPSIDVSRAAERVRRIVEISRRFSRCGIHLVMNGVDRKSVQVEVARRLREISELAGVELELARLSDAVAAIEARRDGLSVFEGEALRPSLLPLLPASSSSRPELKKLLFLVERLLARYLEPMTALSAALRALPPSLRVEELDGMWRELLKLLSHDAACGTVSDEVYIELLGRSMALLKRVGSALAHLLMYVASRAGPRPGLIVFNPLPWRATVPIEVVAYPPTNETVSRSCVEGSEMELLEEDPAFPRYVTVAELGPTSITYLPLERCDRELPSVESVERGVARASLGGLEVEVDARRGVVRARLGGVAVDIDVVADEEKGDLYNHDPGSSSLSLLRGSIERCWVYRGRVAAWVSAEFESSIASGVLKLVLYERVPRIDVFLDLVVRREGYRISVLLRTEKLGRVVAYTPGIAVERSEEVVAGEEERFEEFPFQEWVALAGGSKALVVGARGLYEYRSRAMPRASELFVTLVRSVPQLSKSSLASRRSPAGPSVRTRLAEELGHHRFELCLALAQGDLSEALRIVKSFVDPPIAAVVDGSSESSKPVSASVLEVESSGFVELHSARLRGRDLVLRLGAPLSSARAAVRIRMGSPEIWLATLSEDRLRKVGVREASLELGRGKIATLIARGWLGDAS